MIRWGILVSMKSIEYNKLVRDRIPEIIEKAGKQAIVEKVGESQLIKLLNKKLEEELIEYLESGNVEELADLVEVVYGILDHKGVSIEEFERIRQEKNEKRGAFREGLVLIKVIEQ